MVPEGGVLTNEQERRLCEVILPYSDVFVVSDGEVGFSDKITHEKYTGGCIARETRLLSTTTWTDGTRGFWGLACSSPPSRPGVLPWSECRRRMAMRPRDAEKMAFVAHRGLWRWRQCPSAPAMLAVGGDGAVRHCVIWVPRVCE
jgi:hypothetical protein